MRQCAELVAESLFDLELGRLEDQVDLFQTPGSPMSGRTRIAMRDGPFYVANGGAHKIMVFSSYGDLLFLLYDPMRNPTPTLASAPRLRSASAATGARASPESIAPPAASTGLLLTLPHRQFVWTIP